MDYYELFSTGEKKRPKRKYKYNPEWEGSPFREFKIHAIRSAKKGRKVESWPCAFEVQFKKDGKVGLWKATIDEKNVLDINMSCLDKLVLFMLYDRYFILVLTRKNFF